MLDELYELMGKFENDGWGYYSHFPKQEVDEDTGEIYLVGGQAASEAIADLFHANGFTSENFSVEQSTWSVSPSVDEGYVSVAWCENGKLYHEVFTLYN